MRYLGTPFRIFLSVSTVLVLVVSRDASATAPRNAAGKNDFVCGANNVFLADEEMVVSLLDSLTITRPRVNGALPRIPKRGQCGLPGENFRICTACTSAKEGIGFEQVLPFLADKSHRDWHAIWHKIRRDITDDGVNNLGPSKNALDEWSKQGWIPADTATFLRDHRIGGPLAGEDFFYMHRQMIKMVQIEMTNAGLPCISPWLDLPANALDPKWPVPRAVSARKREFISEEQKLIDEAILVGNDLRKPELLKSISFSELGSKVESLLHGKLHILYAGPLSTCKDPETDDSLQCDDLTHDRTAHLNIYFWKLHGFVDQFIGAWLKANGKTEIAMDCSKSATPATCQQWRGHWLGKLP